MDRVRDKVALVTGGAGNIGSAIVQRLTQEGAKVVIADIAIDKARDLAATVGSAAHAVHLDATDDQSIAAMVAAARDRWGRLDILVNNVGHTGVAADARDTTVLDTSLETWDLSFTVNVRSVFLATKYALPHLIERGESAVVNIGSVSGLGGDGMFVAYGASKAALINFGRYVAAQYGRQGVRCNTVCPGPVANDRRSPEALAAALNANYVPALGETRHIAALVAYLASEEAAYTNGAVITCDGGLDSTITPWRP